MLRNAIVKLYFGTAYNTTVGVNILMMLGVISPVIVLTALCERNSLTEVISLTALTIVTTYWYMIIYLVNDSLDYEKDVKLGIPKQTAQSVLGSSGIPLVLITFGLVLAGAVLAWPKLAMLAPAYCIFLIGLSAAHTLSHRAKIYTIFIERWCKHIMPLMIGAAATSESMLVAATAAVIVGYPAMFMTDYTLQGYLRDRLHLPANRRWHIYALYYAAVAGTALLWLPSHCSPTLLAGIAAYAVIYAGLMLTARSIAPRLPLSRVDAAYPSKTAHEKRQLISYGLMQAVIILAMSIYAAIS